MPRYVENTIYYCCLFRVQAATTANSCVFCIDATPSDPVILVFCGPQPSGLKTACPAWPVFRAFTAVSYVTGAPVSCDEAYLNRLPKADAIVLNLWLVST